MSLDGFGFGRVYFNFRAICMESFGIIRNSFGKSSGNWSLSFMSEYVVHDVDDEDSRPVPIKHKPLSEVVADQLMDWIMDGTLQAGEKINSEAISRRLGVSRTPVREALKFLEQTGLVTSTPYVGTSVNKLLIEDINEIYVLRELLETFVIRKVVAFVTSTDIRKLEEIQEKIEAEVNAIPRDIKTIFKLNQEFHMKLYGISGMQRLCEMIDSLWSNLSFFRLLHANNPTYGDKAKKEHRDYIDALKRGDSKKLERMIVANLLNHAEQMPALVSGYYKSLEKKK